MSRDTRILVCCGEASGDLYAAELVRELRLRRAGIETFGLGGDRLAAQGARLLAHIRDVAVVGIVEVLSHISRLRALKRAVLEEVDRQRPDVAVLVDYGGFNLRLARDLRERGIPIAYYVSPQVWAWRRHRVRILRHCVREMLVIFPFEEPFFREADVPVRFVGHPLAELLQRPTDPSETRARLGLDAERPLVPILPGSRPGEVRSNLPPLRGAVRRLCARRPELQFAVAGTQDLPPELLEEAWQGLPVRVFRGETHALLGAARAAIVASGTATVEAALLGAPMVVVYRVAWLSYLLGRPLVRVPHYAMANLIAGRRIVTELIQGAFTPARVEAELLAIIDDPDRERRMREELGEVKRRLGGPGASGRAAEAVLELLDQASPRAREG